MHVDERGAARRRAPLKTVSVDGFDGEIPEPVDDLSAKARKFYDTAWRSPSACSWVEADKMSVELWAILRASISDDVAEGKRPQAAIIGQIKGYEDALGLSPKSRTAQRINVIDGRPSDDSSGVVDPSDANEYWEARFSGSTS